MSSGDPVRDELYELLQKVRPSALGQCDALLKKSRAKGQEERLLADLRKKASKLDTDTLSAQGDVMSISSAPTTPRPVSPAPSVDLDDKEQLVAHIRTVMQEVQPKKLASFEVLVKKIEAKPDAVRQLKDFLGKLEEKRKKSDQTVKEKEKGDAQAEEEQARQAEEVRRERQREEERRLEKEKEEKEKDAEERRAEEVRLAEERRVAEERKAEEARLAEEAEEAKRAEEAGKAEARIAEAKRQEKEETRQAEAAQEARRAEEVQKAEQARKAEEARRAEEVEARKEKTRREEEAQKAEEARRADETRRAEEAHQAEEALRMEEARQEEARAEEKVEERKAEQLRGQEPIVKQDAGEEVHLRLNDMPFMERKGSLQVRREKSDMTCRSEDEDGYRYASRTAVYLEDEQERTRLQEAMAKLQTVDVVEQALASGEWKARTDPKSGKVYYWNTKTKETCWNLKAKLQHNLRASSLAGSRPSSPARKPSVDFTASVKTRDERRKKEKVRPLDADVISDVEVVQVPSPHMQHALSVESSLSSDPMQRRRSTSPMQSPRKYLDKPEEPLSEPELVEPVIEETQQISQPEQEQEHGQGQGQEHDPEPPPEVELRVSCPSDEGSKTDDALGDISVMGQSMVQSREELYDMFLKYQPEDTENIDLILVRRGLSEEALLYEMKQRFERRTEAVSGPMHNSHASLDRTVGMRVRHNGKALQHYEEDAIEEGLRADPKELPYMPDAEGLEVIRLLEVTYRRYNPTMVPYIPVMIRHFEGSETTLLSMARQKYAPHVVESNRQEVFTLAEVCPHTGDVEKLLEAWTGREDLLAMELRKRYMTPETANMPPVFEPHLADALYKVLGGLLMETGAVFVVKVYFNKLRNFVSVNQRAQLNKALINGEEHARKKESTLRKLAMLEKIAASVNTALLFRYYLVWYKGGLKIMRRRTKWERQGAASATAALRDFVRLAKGTTTGYGFSSRSPSRSPARSPVFSPDPRPPHQSVFQEGQTAPQPMPPAPQTVPYSVPQPHQSLPQPTVPTEPYVRALAARLQMPPPAVSHGTAYKALSTDTILDAIRLFGENEIALAAEPQLEPMQTHLRQREGRRIPTGTRHAANGHKPRWYDTTKLPSLTFDEIKERRAREHERRERLASKPEIVEEETKPQYASLDEIPMPAPAPLANTPPHLQLHKSKKTVEVEHEEDGSMEPEPRPVDPPQFYDIGAAQPHRQSRGSSLSATRRGKSPSARAASTGAGRRPLRASDSVGDVCPHCSSRGVALSNGRAFCNSCRNFFRFMSADGANPEVAAMARSTEHAVARADVVSEKLGVKRPAPRAHTPRATSRVNTPRKRPSTPTAASARKPTARPRKEMDEARLEDLMRRRALARCCVVSTPATQTPVQRPADKDSGVFVSYSPEGAVRQQLFSTTTASPVYGSTPFLVPQSANVYSSTPSPAAVSPVQVHDPAPPAPQPLMTEMPNKQGEHPAAATESAAPPTKRTRMGDMKIVKMSQEGVAKWLDMIGFTDFKPQFAKAKVAGGALLRLEFNDLVRTFQMESSDAHYLIEERERLRTVAARPKQ